MNSEQTDPSRLGELLVEMRLVDESVMKAAVAEHRASGRRLARILAERRVLDEERLTRAVAAKLGLDAVSVAGVQINERVLSLVPASLAQSRGVIPVAVKRTQQTELVYLVMADPLDSLAIAEVQQRTGRKVRVLMAKASEVDAAIAQLYGGGPRTTSDAPRQAVDPRVRRTSGGTRVPGSVPPTRPMSERPTVAASGTRPSIQRSVAGRLSISPHKSTPPTPIADTPPLMQSSPPPAPVARAQLSIDDPTGPSAAAGERSERGVPPAPVSPSDLDEPDGIETRIEDPFAKLEDDRGRPLAAPDQEWARSMREWEGSEHSPFAANDKLDWGSQVPGDAADRQPTVRPTPAMEQAVGAPPTPVPASPTPDPEAPPKALRAAALEIPVNWEEKSHPFQGPSAGALRVGLERTAIIPADELIRAEFEPPPLDPEPADVALAGTDDIPTTSAAVEARAGGADGEDADIEEVSLEPIEAPTETPSSQTDSRRIPVLEPSRLVSLMEDPDGAQQDTGADSAPLAGLAASDLHIDPPTPQVEDVPARTVSRGPTVLDVAEPEAEAAAAPETAGAVLTALDEALGPAPAPPPLPRPTKPPVGADEATRHATALVAALRSGDSLSAAQRAEVLLAVCRLLLDKGLFTEAELLRALLQ